LTNSDGKIRGNTEPRSNKNMRSPEGRSRTITGYAPKRRHFVDNSLTS
jgi:hypothetical protein